MKLSSDYILGKSIQAATQPGGSELKIFEVAARAGNPEEDDQIYYRFASTEKEALNYNAPRGYKAYLAKELPENDLSKGDKRAKFFDVDFTDANNKVFKIRVKALDDTKVYQFIRASAGLAPGVDPKVSEVQAPTTNQPATTPEKDIFDDTDFEVDAVGGDEDDFEATPLTNVFQDEKVVGTLLRKGLTGPQIKQLQKRQIMVPASEPVQSSRLSRRGGNQVKLSGDYSRIACGVTGCGVAGEKEEQAAKDNPFAICNAELGGKKTKKRERCIRKVKDQVDWEE